MRSHPFNYALREDESAPTAGAMPTPPSNPSSSDTHNDSTARNTLLGISPEVDKKVDRHFTVHEPLVDKSGKPIFPHHGMLSGDVLPVDIVPLDNGNYEVTFKYEAANKQMIVNPNTGSVVPEEDIKNKKEILDKKFVEWLKGHGWLGGSKGQPQPPMGGDPMGGGMPGGAPPMGGPMGGAPPMGGM